MKEKLFPALQSIFPSYLIQMASTSTETPPPPPIDDWPYPPQDRRNKLVLPFDIDGGDGTIWVMTKKADPTKLIIELGEVTVEQRRRHRDDTYAVLTLRPNLGPPKKILTVFARDDHETTTSFYDGDGDIKWNDMASRGMTDQRREDFRNEVKFLQEDSGQSGTYRLHSVDVLLGGIRRLNDDGMEITRDTDKAAVRWTWEDAEMREASAASAMISRTATFGFE